MNCAWTRTGIVGVALVGMVTTAAVVRMGAQETPSIPTLEQRVAQLEEVVNSHAADIDRLARMADGLVAGAVRLAFAADQARIKGFEEAGANPAAKTELIEGLRAFHEAVRLAAEPPKPAPAENERK